MAAMVIGTVDKDLLMAARSASETNAAKALLKGLTEEELALELADVPRARAFWINLYNAFALLALRGASVDLHSRIARARHYARRNIHMAGATLSLNDIEHGILRGGRLWWSFGYFHDPFAPRFMERFRLPLDPRIHFALNCGAVSCPPIGFYMGDRLEQQLELATASFLETSVRYDQAANIVKVSPLLHWYRADLGGYNGIIALLQRYGTIPSWARPRIRSTTYDWTPITL
jgi:Protein of unknown function, DUF547